MTFAHHPDEATLMSFSAGVLPSALQIVVACHAEVCSECAATLHNLDEIGGALMSGLSNAAMAKAAPRAALRRLKANIAMSHGVGESEFPADLVRLPEALRALAGERLDQIAWKPLGLGIWQVRLGVGGADAGDLRLIKAAPRTILPGHAHGGTELTMILAGGYRDEFGRYRVGDVSEMDDCSEHRPIADDVDGCVCLLASERPARFNGVFARAAQPLIIIPSA